MTVNNSINGEKPSEVIALFVHIGEIVLFFFMTKGSCIASNNLTRDSGKLLGVGKWACQSKDSLYLIENILMVKQIITYSSER
jgi:hypothetical protein